MTGTLQTWIDRVFYSEFGAAQVGPETLILILLLAFCIGQVIGWVYMWTHTGLSYSAMFVASLVVMPPLVGFVMALMSGDIVVAVGLMAVFAMVRFRNVLKDTRDSTFVLWAIIQGMALGSLHFSTAVVGCLGVSMLYLYLWLTGFGSRNRYDVIVSLQTLNDATITSLRDILRRHSVRVQLASQRDLANQARDLSYRLLLRDPTRSNELLTELESADGIAHVSLYHREDESEV